VQLTRDPISPSETCAARWGATRRGAVGGSGEAARRQRGRLRRLRDACTTIHPTTQLPRCTLVAGMRCHLARWMEARGTVPLRSMWCGCSGLEVSRVGACYCICSTECGLRARNACATPADPLLGACMPKMFTNLVVEQAQVLYAERIPRGTKFRCPVPACTFSNYWPWMASHLRLPRHDSTLN
jgi:hypothetical protein